MEFESSLIGQYHKGGIDNKFGYEKNRYTGSKLLIDSLPENIDFLRNQNRDLLVALKAQKRKYRVPLVQSLYQFFINCYNNFFTRSITCCKLPTSCPPALANVFCPPPVILLPPPPCHRIVKPYCITGELGILSENTGIGHLRQAGIIHFNAHRQPGE